MACLRTPPAFVDAAAELLAPLLGAAPVAVLPAGAAADAGALVSALAAARVTRLTAVPTLLAALVQHLAAGELPADSQLLDHMEPRAARPRLHAASSVLLLLGS